MKTVYCVLSLSILFGFCSGLDKKVKTFTVDLDAAPIDRWPPVIKAMGPVWVAELRLNVAIIMEEAFSFLPLKERLIADQLISVGGAELNKYLPYPYADEMIGLSKATNISLGDIVFLNFFYELDAYKGLGIKACTSIVGQNTDNTIYHGRNLDFDFSEQLRHFTVNVNFTRKGKIHFHGATFVGLTGLVTGSAPGRFAISFDERHNGTLTKNFQNALNGGRTTMHEVRYVLDIAPDYNTAVKMLTTAHTIAPEYFIVSGVKPGEGCVITGDRDHSIDVYPLAPSEGRWYLVETNYDRWTTPPPNDDRRDPAIRDMNLVGQSRFNAETLFAVLSVPPVLNNSTVYTTIMSAAEPDLFYTRVRDYDEAINFLENF